MCDHAIRTKRKATKFVAYLLSEDAVGGVGGNRLVLAFSQYFVVNAAGTSKHISNIISLGCA